MTSNALSASVTTSAAEIERIIYKFAEKWSAKDPNDSASYDFAQLWSATGSYTDHAFQVRRSGHVSLQNHFNIWRHAHPDFVLNILEILQSRPVAVINDDHIAGPADNTTMTSSAIEHELQGKKLHYILARSDNRGTWINNLPSRKATGERWSFPALLEFWINCETGKIEVLHEWYSFNFQVQVKDVD